MTERGSTSAGRLEPSVGMSGWLAARLPVFYGWVIVAVGALESCSAGRASRRRLLSSWTR